jgi:hypothetical protein
MKSARRITTHRILIVAAAAFMALLVHPIHAQSKMEKEAAVLKYQGKILIVKKDGIATGSFVKRIQWEPTSGGAALNIINDAGVSQVIAGTELVRKGEVLKITAVHLINAHRVSGAEAAHGFEKGGYLDLTVENLSPHAVTRGIGAFAHQSMELGRAFIAFRAGPNGVDFTAADALVAQWFTLLDGTNSADAARLGNTASGVFVDQVKTGMNFAEVESALGVPQTRIDLGEKVLYKYRDMTVEFHDGKVTDVR